MLIDFKVALPERIFHHEEVTRIRATATHGEFCILPRHIDCVADLIPGLVYCETPAGEERHFAVDGGILVKCGASVSLATPRAVRGESDEELHAAVTGLFAKLEDREVGTRSALRRIGANFVRSLIEVEEDVQH
jgi:F-type H+-transporting ATPase subunit epsilon